MGEGRGISTQNTLIQNSLGGSLSENKSQMTTSMSQDQNLSKSLKQESSEMKEI